MSDVSNCCALANEDAQRYEHELRTSQLAYADWLSLHGEYDRATPLYEEVINVCSAPQASDRESPDTKSLNVLENPNSPSRKAGGSDAKASGEGPCPLSGPAGPTLPKGRVNSKTPSKSLLGGALHGQANILLAQDALDEARQLFQQAIVLQEQTLPAEPEAAVCRQWLCRHLCRLGTAWYRAGQVDQARAAWTKAVEVYEAVPDTSDAAVQDDVAWMLIDGSEIWDAATQIATAEAAVQRMPSSAALWMALGVGRCRSRRWQDALDALREADRLGEDHSGLHFFLAMATWQTDERLEALAWYERAVDALHEHAAREHDFLRCRAEADACIGSALAILGTEQPEGSDALAADYVFTLKRFGDTSGSVTLDWATSDGTARAGATTCRRAAKFILQTVKPNDRSRSRSTVTLPQNARKTSS